MSGTEYDNEFIELNRTFHELSKTAGDSDDADLRSVFYTGSGITWSQLLTEYRVVLLSEAGSGKTEEIRNAARKLRSEGKTAFFLRLEHVPADFEDAFEEGSYREFEAWIASDDEGWLLLDSVDEARLKSPGDFELAIKKIGRKIVAALQRSHIVVTGRTPAWRPKTDLALCANNLPYAPQRETVETVEQGHGTAADTFIVREDNKGEKEPPFTIMTLDDLRPAQIEKFARAKGALDIQSFMDAIERADAYSFTSRPQDLVEVVEFWQDHERIGSRLELMRNSIARRLTERDQNRAEAKPMNADRTRRGAKLAAGATTLVQNQTIRVPDGGANLEGLPIIRVLPDWDETDCSTLLSRPIFDDAIYGAVRFHHRSVREYLAAEWLNDLLREETSRRSIEEIFFREQYGLEVMVPSARPLLPWMMILDERIRERALRLAPELVFEGGDPSQLPLETRRKLLRDICGRIAGNRSNRSGTDFAAVQRFASAELAGDVAELLKEHADNSDVSWLLLRMVWQGQMTDVLPAAKSAALDPKTSKYSRIAAFRAIAEIGSEADQADVRAAFLKERRYVDRTWLAELINSAKPNRLTAAWLLSAVAKSRAKEQFSTDGLAEAIISFVEQTDLVRVAALVTGMSKLLARPPVVERRYCEISKRYRWLARIAALGVQRLIEARHEAALLPTSLDVLRRYWMAHDHDDYEVRKMDLRLPEFVQGWSELRNRLFWFEAAKTRKSLNKKKGERLTDWWRVSHGSSLWSWCDQDFNRVLDFIGDRPLLDDKLIALSVAFDLYRRAGRSRKQGEAIWKAITGNSELETQLRQYMHPPAQSTQMRALKQDERRWKKRQEQRNLKDAKSHENWRIYLLENIEKLRDPGLAKAAHISNAQYYLHRQQEDDEGHHHWTGGNWKSLIPRHGEDVAHAFRDGVVAYWRRNKPKLRSDGAEPNCTSFSIIFGLTGIGIEADETLDWPKKLTKAEAELATRYATHELNGFPPWLQKLYATFADSVTRVLLAEIRWELGNASPEGQSHYVLSDVSWHGEWMWEKWAPILLDELCRHDPVNLSSLGQMLKIIQGSPLPDEQIRDLAAAKCQSVAVLDQLAYWYAAWVGVDPENAISSLARRLDDIVDTEARLTFAMQFITHLVGGRRGESSTVRNAYRTAMHLKTLYLLMHKHVRQRDDIERAGKGVYSPGLRDDSQDARNHLFSLLKEIPGKEAFLALMEISKAHPERTARPWFTHHAKTKAEQDAETGPWSIKQFVDFNKHLERTPANHRELFELAWMRLLDLKNDLEEGDSSIASILKTVTLETEMRKYIGNCLREQASGRYSVTQEEEFADATRPDLRFHGAGFDAPVPIELKLADNWTGPHLFERLENQLCRDYLRDARSNRGIFCLVYRGSKKKWTLPNGKSRMNFDDLVSALQNYWVRLSPRFANVDEIRVIGIDLTKRRTKPKQAAG